MFSLSMVRTDVSNGPSRLESHDAGGVAKKKHVHRLRYPSPSSGRDQIPNSVKWKIRFLRNSTRLTKILDTTRCLTGDLFQPQFMSIERPDVLNRFMRVHALCICINDS
jgi:hypothetical protein